MGARVLAELGDDRARFADDRTLKSYAGSAPITRASGKKRFVGRLYVKNNRLINAGFSGPSPPSPPNPEPTLTTHTDPTAWGGSVGLVSEPVG